MPDNTKPCNGCGKPILWVKTAASGRPMPLDPEPTDSGNVVLDDQGRAVVLGKANLFEQPPAGPRYMPHHATCVNADRFRRKP